MKKTTLKTIALQGLLILLFFAACKKDTPAPATTTATTADPFEFIKVGHYWNYVIYTEVKASGNTIIDTSTISETLLSDLGAGKYSVIDSIHSHSNNTDTIITIPFTWFKDENMWARLDSSGKKSMVLSSKPLVGEKSFSSFLKTHQQDTLFSQIISINEIVKLPLGNFSCIKVHSNTRNNNWDFMNYYSPKYGLIKVESTIVISGVNIKQRRELKSKNF